MDKNNKRTIDVLRYAFEKGFHLLPEPKGNIFLNKSNNEIQLWVTDFNLEDYIIYNGDISNFVCEFLNAESYLPFSLLLGMGKDEYLEATENDTFYDLLVSVDIVQMKAREFADFVLSSQYSKTPSVQKAIIYGELYNFNEGEYTVTSTFDYDANFSNWIKKSKEKYKKETVFKAIAKAIDDNEFFIPSKLFDTIRFTNFEDLIRYCLYDLAKNNQLLKKCKNCGKYFCPSNRSDEIYCDNVFKNEKTCKQLGYEIKVDNDELLKTYRMAYKTANAWKNRNKLNFKNIEVLFDKWHKLAKEQLRKAQNGDIGIDEYKQWFKDNSFRIYVKSKSEV